MTVRVFDQNGVEVVAGLASLPLAESDVTGLVTDLAAKCSTTDSRLSDARTPTAHAASHEPGGSDLIHLNELVAPNSDVDFNSQKIFNLADPTNAQEAATKNYVDTHGGGGGGGASGASGDIQFSDGSGVFSSDDVFNWDDVNKRLSIGGMVSGSPVPATVLVGANANDIFSAYTPSVDALFLTAATSSLGSSLGFFGTDTNPSSGIIFRYNDGSIAGVSPYTEIQGTVLGVTGLPITLNPESADAVFIGSASDDGTSARLQVNGDISSSGIFWSQGQQGWSGTFTSQEGFTVNVNGGLVTSAA